MKLLRMVQINQKMVATSAREVGFSVLLRYCIGLILTLLNPEEKPECLGMVKPMSLVQGQRRKRRSGDSTWSLHSEQSYSIKPEEPRKMGRPLELFGHSRYFRFRIFHEDAQLEDQLLQISHMYSSGNPLTPVISVP